MATKIWHHIEWHCETCDARGCVECTNEETELPLRVSADHEIRQPDCKIEEIYFPKPSAKR